MLNKERHYREIERDGVTVKVDERGKVVNIFMYARYGHGTVEEIKATHKSCHIALDMVKQIGRERNVD